MLATISKQSRVVLIASNCVSSTRWAGVEKFDEQEDGECMEVFKF